MEKGGWYESEDIKIKLAPTVFHPGLFFSTHILYRFMKEKDLLGKTVLELGAGSGFISIGLAKMGAKVTSSDINPEAITTIRESAQANKVVLTCMESDLFDQIPKQTFDFILINPPYYPKAPSNAQEMAFYCGAEFEYFEKLFSQLGSYFTNGQVYMILSNDCDIQRISTIAQENKLKLETSYETSKWGEQNIIYEAVRIQ